METVELAYDVFQTEDTRSDLNPIIMMFGIGWSKFLFRDLARDLCHATKRKVFTLDMRNHGVSPVTQNCTITLMIEDVKRFMKEQEIKKVVFICHSYSNSIAYMIALEKPEAVEKMLMIDNPPFNDVDEKFNNESVYPQLWAQNRLLKTLDNKMTLKDAKAKFISLAEIAGKGHQIFYKKAAYDIMKVNGKFQWKVDFDYLLAQYRNGFLSLKPTGSSNIDILIIRCENSGRVPDSKFEAVLRHNPNAKLMTFENTTHLLMYEEQEKFVQAAKDFLKASE